MVASHTEAHLDKFKMEALGDVKQAYLDARSRAQKLYTSGDLNLGDGYFILNGRTQVSDKSISPKGYRNLRK